MMTLAIVKSGQTHGILIDAVQIKLTATKVIFQICLDLKNHDQLP